MARTDIQIRPAKLQDAPRLADLAKRTFLDTFGADNRPEHIKSYVSKAFSVEQVKRELTDSRSIFLLALADSTPIGYAKLHNGNAPECVTGAKPIELERIYVKKTWLRHGIGSVLMQAAMRSSKKRGHETIWLGVWERNTRAQRFYERYGFHTVGAKDFMLGSDCQTDLVMQFSFDAPSK